MLRMKILTIVILVAAAFGFFIGGVVLYVTWQHNPQCEFHCEGVINWSNWLTYGFIASLFGFVVSIPLGLLGAMVAAIYKAKRA